jgi:hypothetical protein
MNDGDNVEELSSGNIINKGGGKVFVIDPNPPGMDILPPEDLFIYVKFSAYPRSRTTYGGQSKEGNNIFRNLGVEDEVNFISTEIKYDNNGKLSPNPQETYSTTNWTNLGGFSNSRSGGILEGFGIKSINIKYNASFVPEVDITFTDVRGGALFDLIQDEDIVSPYAVFFKLPYPVFKLSVKGYYGQMVDYCLHMLNWTTTFDSTTGNFDISANFVGFQQAFLSDMVIGNIIGVVNTTEGYNKLNKIYDLNKSQVGLGSSSIGKSLADIRQSGELNVRKLDDFFTKIAKLQIDSEVIKSDMNSFNVLKDLNGRLTILKSISSFLGTSIPKDNNNQNSGDGNYLNIPNSKSQIDGSTIKDNNLQLRKNYLSIRDYLIINSGSRNSFKDYVITLNSLILKYKEYLNSDSRVPYKPVNSVQELSEKKRIDKLNGFFELNPTDEKLISSFNDITNENNWLNFVSASFKNSSNEVTGLVLSTVLEKMYTSGDVINLNNDYNKGKNNEIFEINTFIKEVNNSITNSNSNNSFYGDSLLPQSNVFVVDFREQRVLVDKSIQELKDVIKEQSDIVQKDLNNTLLVNFKKENNFNPTINSCFEILMNNTQAMLETISDITKLSESSSLLSKRNEVFNKSEIKTDLPSSIKDKLSENNLIKGIAWVSFYQESTNGDRTEIYIGDTTATRNDFPEYDFVERVFDNLVSKTPTLDQITKSSVSRNGLDGDNWFPINPMDSKVNPFIKFNSLTDIKSINDEFIKEIINRVTLLTNYSLFDKTTGGELSVYGKFDAINAYETIINNQVKLIMKNSINTILNDINSTVPLEKTSILGNSSFFTSNIQEVPTPLDSYIYKETKLPVFGEYRISGTFNKFGDYIAFDESSILNNSKKLWSSILQTEEYSKLTKPDSDNGINVEERSGELYYKNYYSDSNNLTTNNLFNVWDVEVSKNLLTSNGNKITNISSSKLTDINPLVNDNSKYINMTYFNNSGQCSYETYVLESNLYKKQSSNYSRCYLLLSTIPFRTFKEGFINSVFNGKPNRFFGSRVVQLPSIYVYFIGSLLWRYQEGLKGVDPINFSVTSSGSTCDYNIFKTPYTEYLTKITYFNSKGIKDKSLDSELKVLPENVKNQFIKKFKSWVDSNFTDTFTGNFEKTISNTYSTSTLDVNTVNKSKRDLLNYLIETTNLIIFNPNIFNPSREEEGLLFNTTDLITYIKKFKEIFDKNVDPNTQTKNTEKEDNNKNKNNEIKLQIYNYFKNINDKWVSDTDKSFNVCGVQGASLYSYFKFIDRGWRDIGDFATFNLKSFLSLGSNLNTSMYFYMSKLLRDSNFLLQILPNYIDYKNKIEVSKMFKPLTTLETNSSSGPVYCCVFIGGSSQVLDIRERSNYYYENDGFKFKSGEIPQDITDSNKADDFSLVAFRVSLGAQNQSIFKDISMSQQEHRATAEYFQTLADVIDKRGGTQKTYVGTDLLSIFKTRSYTTKISGLGCMNIQPMMYFDLQNVPFFNGAYMITNVSHNITPNHMTTSFEGIRQSKYISPPITKITTDLDVDLNESSNVPKLEFTNLKNTNPIFSIGLTNPTEEFNWNNFTLQKFYLLGVSKESITQDELNTFVTILKNENIVSNSQVTMFISNVLSQSNYLSKRDFTFNVNDLISSEVKFPSNDTNYPDQTKYYVNSLSGQTYSGITSYRPVSNVGLEFDVAYNPKSSNLPGSDEYVKFNGTNGDSLKYFNIYEGDSYRFQPRGYLYLTGRREYFKYYKEEGLKNPSIVSNSSESSFKTSIMVWKGKTDESNKTSYDYSGLKDGTSSIFEKTTNICQDVGKKSISENFLVFEKVLTTFVDKNGVQLINYFKP